MNVKSIADIAGPWNDSRQETDLTNRCKEFWNVPVNQLPSSMLATFLRQRIALELMIPEARYRLESGINDDSEMFDGELADALKEYGSAES